MLDVNWGCYLGDPHDVIGFCAPKVDEDWNTGIHDNVWEGYPRGIPTDPEYVGQGNLAPGSTCELATE